MSAQKKLALTATNLRYVLAAALLLMFAACGAGFYYVHGYLKSYAEEASALNSQAEIGTKNIVALQNIERYIEEHKHEFSIAEKVVAESKSYRYQNEIVNDLSKIADKSGVNITGFQFGDQAAGATSGSSSSSSSTAAPAAGTAPATPSTTAGGLKTTKATITISSPVNYDNLLEFISRIERNITKMQIARIAISQTEEGGRNSVASETFEIEVYIR